MIRKASFSDLNEIIKIYQKAFKTKIPLSYFKWKYFNKYIQTEMWVFEENSEIRAFYGVLFLPFNKNKKIALMADACSDIKSKKFGKKNSDFIKLSEFIFNNLKKKVFLIIGFTGIRHYKLAKYIFYGNKISNILIYTSNRYLIENSDFAHFLNISHVKSLKEKLSLLENINNNLQIYKNYDYFKWRYEEYLFENYSFWLSEIGLIITKIKENNLIIEDFLIRDNEQFKFISFIKGILKFYSYEEIYKVRITISENHSFNNWLQYYNIFQVELEKNYFALYYSNMDLQINPKNFVFTGGDIIL